MTTNNYKPSEFEIRSLGIGLINNKYLDLDKNREFLVIGDIDEERTELLCGQKHTTYNSSETYNILHTRDILYSTIVNNSGIGINTTRNNFDNNFTNQNIKGLFVNGGKIECWGRVAATGFDLLDESTCNIISFNGSDINSNFSNILNQVSEKIDNSIKQSHLYPGFNNILNINGRELKRNNLYTDNFLTIGGIDTSGNISADSSETIGNMHPLNIISDTITNSFEGIQLAIKNKAMVQDIIINDSTAGENIEKIYNEPASLKMGIIGNLNNSPAIITTTSNMPLEFHISKNTHLLNKLYKNNNNEHYQIPNYNINSNVKPSMTITQDGNISIGSNIVSETINPKLQVYGSAAFDNIYVNDENNNLKKLDDIYYRKNLPILTPEQISDGTFNCNYIFANTVDFNGIISDEITTETLNVSNITILDKLDIKTQNISHIDGPINFKQNVTMNNLSLNNGFTINDSNVDIFNISNVIYNPSFNNKIQLGEPTIVFSNNGVIEEYIANFVALEDYKYNEFSFQNNSNNYVLNIKNNIECDILLIDNSNYNLINNVNLTSNTYYLDYNDTNLNIIFRNEDSSLIYYSSNISGEPTNNITDFGVDITELLNIPTYDNISYNNLIVLFKYKYIVDYVVSDTPFFILNYNVPDTIIIDANSNIIVPGKLTLGKSKSLTTIENNNLVIHKDSNDFEVSLVSENNISYIGHSSNNIKNSDNLIINTTPSENTQNRNIEFYPSVDKNDINTTVPALSINANNKIGINNNNPNFDLDIDGNLSTTNIYVDGKITNTFVQTENNNKYDTYFLNNTNEYNKYFINYNNISDNNSQYLLNTSKGLNVKQGINIYGGYYDENKRLATIKYINNNNTVNTGYINANIYIGVSDIKDKFLETLIKPEETKPLMIRNLSNDNYNDTVIRLYRGKVGYDKSNNMSKYTGIDFCNWDSITGDRNSDRWYIYRNHDSSKQNVINYPGVFEIGYSDTQIHPNKSGLEIMYRRDITHKGYVDHTKPPTENDEQEYYFIFNRPKGAEYELPNTNINNEITKQKTVKIYGDVETDTLHCSNIIIDGVNLNTYLLNNSSGNDNSYTPIQTVNTSYEAPLIRNNLMEIIEDNVELYGYTNYIHHSNATIIGNYDANNENVFNKLYSNNIVLYGENNNSIASFISPYIDNTKDFPISYFDLSIKQFSNTSDKSRNINSIKFCIESIDENIPYQNLDEELPTLFSFKTGIVDNNLLSIFYDHSDISSPNTYFNFGNNQNISRWDSNISYNTTVHINDWKDYLLQLTNTDTAKSAKIKFNKKQGIYNKNWILEGPDINDSFNIKYSENDIDNNNLITLNTNNTVSINDTNSNNTLNIKSTNKSLLNLVNNYNNDSFTDNNYNYIYYNNSNLNYILNSNLNNNKIDISYNINLDKNYIDNVYTNLTEIHPELKGENNFIYKKDYNILDTTYAINNTNKNIKIDTYSTDFKFSNLDINNFDIIENVDDSRNNINIDRNLILPSLTINNYKNVDDLSSNYYYEFDNLSNINNVINESIQIADSVQTIAFNINTNCYVFSNYTYIFNKNIEISNNNIINTFSNILKNNNNPGSTSTETLLQITTNEIVNNNNTYEMTTSNYIIYDIENDAINRLYNVYSTINIPINIEFKIPELLVNDNGLDANIFNNNTTFNIDITKSLNNNYTLEIDTKNYLEKNNYNVEIINETLDLGIFQYNYDLDFLLLNGNKVTKNINRVFNLIYKYEKYNDTTDLVKIFKTNTVVTQPHIIFNNIVNNVDNTSLRNNKLYNNIDGSLEIKHYNNTVDINGKDLLKITPDRKLDLHSDSKIYVDDIYCKNIYHIDTKNQLILDNTNHLNDTIFTHATEHFNLLSSNINIETSNYNTKINNGEFNLNINTSDNVISLYNINNTNSINNANYNVLNITSEYYQQKNGNNYYTLFGIPNNTNSTSYIGINTTYNDIISKNANSKLHVCDGSIYIENSINNEQHIVLNNSGNNKKSSVIFSDNGAFKIGSKNNNNIITNLFEANEAKFNINSPELFVSTLDVKQIRINGSIVSGDQIDNLNLGEVFYTAKDMHIQASSNIHFSTPSHFGITLLENDENNYSIKKHRAPIAQNALSNLDLSDTINYSNIILSSETLNYFIDNSNLYYLNDKLYNSNIFDNTLTEYNIISGQSNITNFTYNNNTNSNIYVSVEYLEETDTILDDSRLLYNNISPINDNSIITLNSDNILNISDYNTNIFRYLLNNTTVTLFGLFLELQTSNFTNIKNFKFDFSTSNNYPQNVSIFGSTNNIELEAIITENKPNTSNIIDISITNSKKYINYFVEFDNFINSDGIDTAKLGSNISLNIELIADINKNKVFDYNIYTDTLNEISSSDINFKNIQSFTYDKIDSNLFINDDTAIYLYNPNNTQSLYNLSGSFYYGYLDNYVTTINNELYSHIKNTIYINHKNKLYISDSDNYSIREYNIRDRELKTIAGYYPFNKIDKIPVNEIRKYGTEIGNGYDARFNNVQDIIYATLNNIEYLIVNDYNTNTSSYRFLIIHLDTYFVSLLKEFNNTFTITNLHFNNENGNLYYLELESGTNDNKLQYINLYDEQYDFTIYTRENQLKVLKTNYSKLLNITSGIFDGVEYPYYSFELDADDVKNATRGYVNSMNIYLDYTNTFVQFGHNNEGEESFIGISGPPIKNIDLKVYGTTQSSNLLIDDDIVTSNLVVHDQLYINNLKSKNNIINLYSDILPINNTYNLGSENNKFLDAYFNKLYLENLNINVINDSVIGEGFGLKNSDDLFTYINLSTIYLTDNNNNDNYLKITSENSTFEITISSNNITDNQKLLFDGIFDTSNIITDELHLESKSYFNHISNYGLLELKAEEFEYNVFLENKLNYKTTIHNETCNYKLCDLESYNKILEENVDNIENYDELLLNEYLNSNNIINNLDDITGQIGSYKSNISFYENNTSDKNIGTINIPLLNQYNTVEIHYKNVDLKNESIITEYNFNNSNIVFDEKLNNNIIASKDEPRNITQNNINYTNAVYINNTLDDIYYFQFETPKLIGNFIIEFEIKFENYMYDKKYNIFKIKSTNNSIYDITFSLNKPLNNENFTFIISTNNDEDKYNLDLTINSENFFNNWHKYKLEFNDEQVYLSIDDTISIQLENKITDIVDVQYNNIVIGGADFFVGYINKLNVFTTYFNDKLYKNYLFNDTENVNSNFAIIGNNELKIDIDSSLKPFSFN